MAGKAMAPQRMREKHIRVPSREAHEVAKLERAGKITREDAINRLVERMLEGRHLRGA